MKKAYMVTMMMGAALFGKAQSVEQGSNIIGLDVRLGIYNTTATDKTYNNGTSYGRAGAFLYSLSYDRGLNNNFTVGGQIKYDAYVIGKDTSAQQLNVAYGIDIDATGAFHFVRSQHVDLYVQADLGYSHIKLANTNLNYEGVYTAGGLAYGLELGARFYLGDHIGLHFHIAYAGYDYPSGTATSLGGATDKISLLFSGSTYGLGLCYKL